MSETQPSRKGIWLTGAAIAALLAVLGLMAALSDSSNSRTALAAVAEPTTAASSSATPSATSSASPSPSSSASATDSPASTSDSASTVKPAPAKPITKWTTKADGHGLSWIAEQITGKGTKIVWQQLYNRNKAKLGPNPNLLHANVTLVVDQSASKATPTMPAAPQSGRKSGTSGRDTVRHAGRSSDRSTSSQPSSSGDGVNWVAIARCESGGNRKAVDPSGTHFGLYQFSMPTWSHYRKGTGAPANPLDASADQQLTVAKKVLKGQGIGAWPVCGRKG